jgi:hypothetical protein
MGKTGTDERSPETTELTDNNTPVFEYRVDHEGDVSRLVCTFGGVEATASITPGNFVDTPAPYSLSCTNLGMSLAATVKRTPPWSRRRELISKVMWGTTYSTPRELRAIS